jgi:hypothetical protein
MEKLWVKASHFPDYNFISVIFYFYFYFFQQKGNLLNLLFLHTAFLFPSRVNPSTNSLPGIQYSPPLIRIYFLSCYKICVRAKDFQIADKFSTLFTV